MSVIIRLQGLPWSANALDIRRFFQGLNIPEGGVHIVGGELGDAFIAFSSDEDARQAMLLDSGKIKDIRLKLMLSSRAEMQKVIEAARSRHTAIQPGVTSPTNPSITAPSAGIIGNNVPAAVLPGQLNVLSSPFDLQPQTVQSSAQQSQLVYVNRMALEQQQQQQNILLPKQSGLDYNESGISNTVAPNFNILKNDQPRDKDLSRSNDRGGRGDYDRDRSRERDKDRSSKGRGRRRSRSRSPRRRSRDRDENYRRRSRSRDDDRDRRGNDRYRDSDSRQINLSSNNPDSNNGNLDRYNDQSPQQTLQPQTGRRGPSRWNRENSPVQQVPPRREMDQRIPGGAGGPASLLLGVQSPDGPEGWDKSPQNARQPLMGDPNFSGFGGSGPQSRNSSPPRGNIVMVRGVPFNAMPVHMRDFFTGLTISQDGITFAVDGRGDRLPVAFVRFASERDRDMALRRPKQYLNNAVVEVVPATEEDLRQASRLHGAVASPNRSEISNKSGNISASNRNCVVLQGIPPMVREGDIVRFLANFNLKDMFLKYDNMGKPCGLCFVELTDPREAERCLEMKGQMMGPNRIDITVISKDEMDAQKTEFRVNSGQCGGNGVGRNPQGFNDRDGDIRESDCCLVQGLPFNVDNRDIYEFFAPSGCTPVAIHLMKDDTDRASGEALCEFANSRLCNIACQQDGAQIRSGARVAVRPISRRHLDESLMMSGAMPNSNNFNNFNNRGGGLNSNQPRGNDPKLSLLGPMPDPRFSGPFQGPNFNGGPNGPRFNGPGMSQQNMMMDHDNRGMSDNGPPQRSGGGRRMSPPMSPQQMQQRQQYNNRVPGAPSKFDRPGTVLEATNIPYRATTDDILDYFQGFRLNDGDVIRKYNNRGQPTGDARVVFETPEEAQAAVRRLNKQSIMGRTISLDIL
ncbi:hypothetical protein CHUAL_003437 [Chamberlinius hualienensis]